MFSITGEDATNDDLRDREFHKSIRLNTFLKNLVNGNANDIFDRIK
jgi:hypothetical protein